MMTWEGMGIMNSWERKQRGWINDYINISSTVHDYPLRDYETYGDAIKINLPNSEYYLLENRQPLSYYSSNWIIPDNGILINKYQNVGIGSGYFRIQCADHKWNWENTNGIYTYPYTKLSPSNNGLFEMDFFGNNPSYTSICVNSPGGYCGGYEQKPHPDEYGDSKDLWDIGYNQVFSPWSNPQASMNNLGIELKSKDINGTMYLDIVFENPEQLCPAKPLWLRITKDYFDPYNTLKYHPILDWLANSEPDLINYNIYRGLVITPGIEPTYSLIATITSAYNQYIDNEIILYDEQSPSLSCIYEKKTYDYRITAVDNQPKESVRSDLSSISGWENPCDNSSGDSPLNNSNIPKTFSIFNYPNPFNPITNIKYGLAEYGKVTIKIYDILGMEIKTLVNEFKNAGYYSVSFDGSNYASGVYFYKIEAGSFVESKKMVLIK